MRSSRQPFPLQIQRQTFGFLFEVEVSALEGLRQGFPRLARAKQSHSRAFFELRNPGTAKIKGVGDRGPFALVRSQYTKPSPSESFHPHRRPQTHPLLRFGADTSYSYSRHAFRPGAEEEHRAVWEDFVR